MKIKNLILIGILISVVLFSGCTQTQESMSDSGSRTAAENGEGLIAPTENEIPTPEIPQGENDEPPNLPI